jgi:hypothetical protein
MTHGPLTPASPEELRQSLAYALRHNGRRAFRGADAVMAEITADHLMEALRQSGYVVMRGPVPEPHSDRGHYKP